MGGGGDTQTTKQEPWSVQKPYLENVFKEAERMYTQQGPDYFPAATTVPFSPESNLALTAQANRAMSGSPLNAAASNTLQNTLEGGFLNNNPFLDATFDQAAGRVGANVASQFAGAGRYGSGAHQDVLQQGLNSLATDIYGGNYARERGMQQQAIGMAPQLAQQDYADIAALGQVGAAREQQAGGELQDQINRFNFYQQLPANKLAQYQQFIQGNYGGTGTTSGGTGGGNPFVGGMGGALSGAQIGGMVAPGAGALPGAVLGGALGLFG